MWHHYSRKRQVDIPGFLGDIESHLEPNHPYKDDDKVTWTHEGTHGINSDLRNNYHLASAYLLNNTAFGMTDITYWKLSDVAKEVPQDLRGDIYKLYMVEQQRYWNDTPCYVIDELSAYLNGTRSGHELKVGESRVRYSLDCAIEMYGYTGTLLKMGRSLSDINDLTSLLLFVKLRLIQIVKIYSTSFVKYDKYNKYVNLSRTPQY